MNEMTTGIPILSLLTFLPLAGAAIALFSGKHARFVALISALLSLALAIVVWVSLPADGSIGMVEHAAWAPSLGIEYHLGVDGLGALMLVLSAIVTLMSIDAIQRAHHHPGLYYGLVLVLESGLQEGDELPHHRTVDLHLRHERLHPVRREPKVR